MSIKMRAVLRRKLLPRIPRGIAEIEHRSVIEPEPLISALTSPLLLDKYKFSKTINEKFQKLNADRTQTINVFVISKPVVTCSGIVTDKWWRFLRVKDPYEHILLLPENRISYNPFSSMVRGRVLICTNQFSSNYFHWLLEVLPIIILARECGLEFDRIYVDQRLGFQKDTLRIIGIPEQVILAADVRSCVQIENATVLSRWDAVDDLPSWVPRVLREHMPKKSIKTITGFKKLFVSRENSQGRRLINEVEVFDKLVERGFKRIYASEFSFAEQVAIFSQAEIIVGIHGAALANIVFCMESAAIVELCPPRYISGCFYHLASTIGLRYSVVVGDGFEESTDHGWAFQMEDFSVNTDILFNAIKQVETYGG